VLKLFVTLATLTIFYGPRNTLERQKLVSDDTWSDDIEFRGVPTRRALRWNDGRRPGLLHGALGVARRLFGVAQVEVIGIVGRNREKKSPPAQDPQVVKSARPKRLPMASSLREPHMRRLY
jgi:hypothetical protein